MTGINWWGVLSALIVLIPLALARPVGILLERDAASGNQFVGLMVFVGVLIGGFGQLLRVYAHGCRFAWSGTVDGVGKLLGATGWALGLWGALLFARVNDSVKEYLLDGVTTIVILACAVVLVASFFRPAKDDVPAASRGKA